MPRCGAAHTTTHAALSLFCMQFHLPCSTKAIWQQRSACSTGALCSALNCDVQHSRPVCQSGKKLSSRASPGETRLVFYFDVGEHYSRDMTEEMLVITHSLECVYMWAHSACIHHTTAVFGDVYILFDSCFIREKLREKVLRSYAWFLKLGLVRLTHLASLCTKSFLMKPEFTLGH